MIRPATTNDIPAAIAVVAACWGKDSARMFAAEIKHLGMRGAYSPVVRVAIEDGRIIGVGSYMRSGLCWGGTFCVNALFVDPGYRSMGIGSALLTAMLDDMTGADLIMLVTEHPGFYSKYGFQPITIYPENQTLMHKVQI